MKLILATRNKHKIKEIKQILKPLKIKVYSMNDFDAVPRVKEDKKTFQGNAVKKAKAFARKFSMPALADDSGLQIKALKGSPGVRSARFAGANPTKEKLCVKVLKLLKALPKSGRLARFVCVMAVVFPSGRTKIVEGEVKGGIGFKMSGRNGFGYDPIFIPNGRKKTFAQMNSKAKNRISHRGRALKKLKSFLNKNNWV